jgi:hypothetical protein
MVNESRQDGYFLRPAVEDQKRQNQGLRGAGEFISALFDGIICSSKKLSLYLRNWLHK